MAYSTESEIRTATGFSDSNKISDSTIDSYIADADSIIDSKIVDRYDLPLSTTPEIINTLSRHIASALLYFNEYGEESQNQDKSFNAKMDWAESILDDIANGDRKLIDSNGDELSTSGLQNPTFKPTDSSSDPEATDSDEAKLSMNQQF